MPGQLKRFFIHIRLGKSAPPQDRILEAATNINKILHKLSHGNFKNVYTSSDGGCFGFVLGANCYAGTIKNALESPEIDISAGIRPTLRDGDGVFVIEIGEDFSESGHGVAKAWLQH